jgi:small-conductance mechanosensitive channel
MSELSFLEKFLKFFVEPILKIGSSEYTLLGIMMFALSVVLLFWVSGLLKYFLVRKILSKYALEDGVSQSVGTIVRYIFVIIGLLILVQASGVDLSALGLLLGALGVGIGFGLQNITDNFISGLIILFSRPIKVGDRVEVGNTVGDVVDISARATTINTNDNITIIVLTRSLSVIL